MPIRNPKTWLPLALFWIAFVPNKTAQAQQQAGQNPNIVIIYADDLGFGDVACYNPRRGKIPTPHLDKLATQGMRFTDAHSSSAVCSPSRYSLLTGRYHWRTRLQQGIVGLWGPPLIAADRLTIGGLLQQNGYQTACIGKWHLGWEWPIEKSKQHLFRGNKAESLAASEEHQKAWQSTFAKSISGGPIERGFDFYFGTDVPNWPPFCFIEQDRTVGTPSTFLPTRLFSNHQASLQGPALEGWRLEPILPALASRTVDYIRDAATVEQPFFIYLPLTSPHTPLAVNEAWQGKSQLNRYADFVMETDAVVGRVLQALEQQGVAENTLVVFTSDNGCAPYIGVADLEAQGHFPSGPFRGYKSDVWEGGHRVPFIARWPGQIEAGTVCDQLINQSDLWATCAAIVNHTPHANQGEDSVNLLPLLKGGSDPVREHSVSQSIRGLIAIRKGSWKLIFGPGSGGWTKGQDDVPAQLYNLEQDPAETSNLYSSEPKRVRDLTRLMEELVRNGRSTPGPRQNNDQAFDWKRFMSPELP